ncbi:MAG: hydrogenase nickel incorporation protein HypB [Planctomycetes bacterium]|nr:hydrogenase nickel incorporation protein HypB [Planctomycetota bacterium]
MKQVEVKKRILAANDAQAEVLRDRFRQSGTLVIDLISSPGSGKTTLLEATARALAPEVSMATIVGDVATELDAQRLQAANMPAYQIVTGGACHLDARMVTDALEKAPFELPQILFIENVGNLVCPASYVLGEDFKVALLSTTEGHDKPFKYPSIFSKADATVITKLDLLEHLDFDMDLARDQVLTLNPRARVLPLSVKTGQGLDAWCEFLLAQGSRKRAQASSVVL